LSNKIIVECSQGCRFPVNLDKHKDRDYVFCPKHKEKIRVRKEHFFSPRLDWEKEKEKRKQDRLDVKEMKRRKPRGAPITIPVMSPLLAEILAAYRKRQREVEKGE